MPKHFTILTEDLPSELVAIKLLKFVDPEVEVVNAIGRQGEGYVRSRLPNLNRAANQHLKVVALLDTDSLRACPEDLIADALGAPRNPFLSVRCPVTEIESWIMADAEALATFLQIREAAISDRPDEFEDAKIELRRLANSSPSVRIRSDFAGDLGVARPGPLYNPMLEEFLLNQWRPGHAERRSPSLARAIPALRALVQA
ncbi:MAG: hypothetical protein JJ884_05070 [Maricaulis sp.]|uniref:hypothetical protein n=1 Tax=Maricaulis sp. TaxID=1486257 RepID=UPI001B08E194|nr:hypothetical protein [Maricaulis sp.]MBO6846869.1 hypothetical protein [Maricaulis sp.]MBO6876227.1 hypothetical protein [Maricaulis sp.]